MFIFWAKLSCLSNKLNGASMTKVFYSLVIFDIYRARLSFCAWVRIGYVFHFLDSAVSHVDLTQGVLQYRVIQYRVTQYRSNPELSYSTLFPCFRCFCFPQQRYFIPPPPRPLIIYTPKFLRLLSKQNLDFIYNWYQSMIFVGTRICIMVGNTTVCRRSLFYLIWQLTIQKWKRLLGHPVPVHLESWSRQRYCLVEHTST